MVAVTTVTRMVALAGVVPVTRMAALAGVDFGPGVRVATRRGVVGMFIVAVTALGPGHVLSVGVHTVTLYPLGVYSKGVADRLAA
ncbi:hypothetical protein GCM10028820_05870 [Tessaracoccus terricola]